MTTAGLRRLMELRTLLEELAAREAARSAVQVAAPGGGAARAESSAGFDSPAESVRDELRKLSDALACAARAGDYPAFAAADRSLHSFIVRSAGVPTLLESWSRAWDALACFHRQSLEYWTDLRVLVDEHEFLADAIAGGDPEAAAAAVRSHLEAVWYRMAESQGGLSTGTDALQRAAAYLEFHLHRPVRLGKVASEIAFVSPGHLSRLFREHYGKSFLAHLQDLRMNKAAELLAHTRLGVAGVARRVGYRDVSRFCAHFRRRYGATPASWRRQWTPTSEGERL